MNNPLSGFYRSPKLYTKLPSLGKFYSDEVMEYPENGEIPVFAMTAKDEMIMKNPDALLNGEAVSQVIKSCVPCVKDPKRMVSNDVDVLLLAVQVATGGETIDISAECPECNKVNEGQISIESCLENLEVLDKSYSFATSDGLTVEVKPYTYALTVKAGIANFHNTRSLQALSMISDPEEQLKEFNNTFIKVAGLNFDLLVDSIASISGTDHNGEEFIVSDKQSIHEYLSNCDSTVSHDIDKKIAEINEIGVQKTIMVTCSDSENDDETINEGCGHSFNYALNFDPVNFFTASLQEKNQKKS